MSILPKRVQQYIERFHVLTLAGQDSDGPWAANCFYVWHRNWCGFLVLTQLKTRHGQIMANSGHLCGTISEQNASVHHLQGIQYSGRAQLLAGALEKEARSLYYQKFAIAKALPAPIWLIGVDELKLTDNRLGFGHKTQWQRPPELALPIN